MEIEQVVAWYEYALERADRKWREAARTYENWAGRSAQQQWEARVYKEEARLECRLWRDEWEITEKRLRAMRIIAAGEVPWPGWERLFEVEVSDGD